MSLEPVFVGAADGPAAVRPVIAEAGVGDKVSTVTAPEEAIPFEIVLPADPSAVEAPLWDAIPLPTA